MGYCLFYRLTRKLYIIIGDIVVILDFFRLKVLISLKY